MLLLNTIVTLTKTKTILQKYRVIECYVNSDPVNQWAIFVLQLPLYAFGGKAKVNIEGVLQDPEQHMWLYLDSDSLCNSFTLINQGDAPAFVKITDGNYPHLVRINSLLASHRAQFLFLYPLNYSAITSLDA